MLKEWRKRTILLIRLIRVIFTELRIENNFFFLFFFYFFFIFLLI